MKTMQIFMHSVVGMMLSACPGDTVDSTDTTDTTDSPGTTDSTGTTGAQTTGFINGTIPLHIGGRPGGSDRRTRCRSPPPRGCARHG